MAGRRRAGQLSSALGFVVASAAAHLGGDVAFGLGVHVNQAQPGAGPADFTPVLHESQLDGTSMHQVDAGGEAVLVTRSTSGNICAIAHTCSHMGARWPTASARATSSSVPGTAPASTSAPATCSEARRCSPNPTFEARTQDGKVEIRRAD